MHERVHGRCIHAVNGTQRLWTDRQQYSVEVRRQEVSRAPWYVSHQLCVLPHLLSAGLAALCGNV